MFKKSPFYQPEGPYVFSEWEDKENTGDQLWLQAVWKNAAGEEYRVQARCVVDLITGEAQSTVKLEDGSYIDTYPKGELEKSSAAYAERMKGRNRPDLGALGSNKPPFKLAA